MRRLKLTLAYDGTRYAGWQVQNNGLAVQAVVEGALEKFLGTPIRVISAGRTDAGVHALGQVICFSTESQIPCKSFRPALQNFLPDDVVIRLVEDVPALFHAQFHAVRKHYRYVIHNAPVTSPFLKNYVAWHRTWLDDRAMQEAANCLIGEHDFRAFETNWPNRATSVRTIYEARVSRHRTWDIWQPVLEQGANESVPAVAGEGPLAISPTGEFGHDSWLGDYVCLDIVGNGFLYNMVRTIVGSLIHVGRGKWPSSRLHEIVVGGKRSAAGETAPAAGLYLVRVEY
jgi:tRNA pseudouridine38-40 synthase